MYDGEGESKCYLQVPETTWKRSSSLKAAIEDWLWKFSSRSNGNSLKDLAQGKRNGLSVGRWGGIIASKASIKVLPSTLPSLRSTVQPLNQGIFSDGSNILSPCQPEIGTNATLAGL
uniref:Uncharacterized protein n=1 Tax=Glossina palpalis gambiensis TaxID=67801 RepID=A0A1B0BS81_9MUSC